MLSHDEAPTLDVLETLLALAKADTLLWHWRLIVDLRCALHGVFPVGQA